ncbi:radical SAM protein [Desulfopila inferna]|uniref:radical SAM protein n=1 Tax=Desulfopila inferna TaxID=468528 RepID=UPI0019669A94|nr:radical SAM protein [Desulfopila inferna]MBM9606638.1 radical SAM protein [Desulfopila inferna]
MRFPENDFHKHPCFNPEAKGKYGRVHLPVAPQCNIKCNFCDRKYDCVNESRPGVTSTVLNPAQAGIYIDKVLEIEPRITVAGIAGPGDPFANGTETMATLRQIKRQHPEIILCLSSNGLAIEPYIAELAELKVSHVTITVCALDPEIGKNIYSWIRVGKIIYRGRKAAEILLSRQLSAIGKLKQHNITVKVNCIIIPGINDHHAEDVAKKMQAIGVDLFNCMAMFPNVNTPFAGIIQPGSKMMEELRTACEKYLPQMRHCTRCRADAVGLLDADRTEEFRSCLNTCSTLPGMPSKQRLHVAVASREGVLVNLHLGEARHFYIWEKTSTGFRQVEKRKAPQPGDGLQRWHRLAVILGDCRAVLSSGAGQTPCDVLTKSGIRTITAAGLIEEGLPAVYGDYETKQLRGRKHSFTKSICSGSGGGCL